ncbi:hypothetical protein KAW65_04965 [candidate division WOR-3 bacterium]|nr:hypothetical protein [candidate division WOR-3 bacterium]
MKMGKVNLDYISIFGDIRGALTMTKEEAKRLFNKDLKEGAKGVYFSRYGGKIVLKSWMPHRKKTKDKNQIKRHKLFLTMHKLACQEKNTLIRPLWNELAKGKAYSGHNMFMGVNMSRVTIKFEWKNLLITQGKINPPKIKKALLQKNKIKLTIEPLRGEGRGEPINKPIGIMLLDQKELKFVHINPVIYNQNPIIIKMKCKEPIIYAYVKDGNKYSPSVSIIPKNYG